MLNKAVCKLCQERHRTRGWTETKENNWVLKGRVWCIGQDEARRRSWDRSPWVDVRGSAPDTCLYAAEQAVSQ